MEYQTWQNDMCWGGHFSAVSAAVEQAVKEAETTTDDNNGEWDEEMMSSVLVALGHTRPVGDSNDFDGFEFHQTAAATPVALMHRVITVVGAHDPKLAAELRASLVGGA